jgi:redox-sensitive bicupin YhaK (pirin superfamily)
VLEGALEHKDSMGNGSVIRPGDVQRMTAGTGVQHSEFNPSADQAVHFLQIWILPERKGLTPGYEQKYFAPDEKRGRLCLIASKDGQEGSVTIHQDARVFSCLLEDGEQVTYSPPKGRCAWLQVTKGGLWLNRTRLHQGDGASADDEESLLIKAEGAAETLLFDLA